MSQVEALVAEKLRTMLGVQEVLRDRKLPSGRRIDLYATNGKNEYFIEVKGTDCNRVVLGQIIDYYAELLKARPQAKLILVCRSVNRAVQEVLRKTGIEVLTFHDLDVPLDGLKKAKLPTSVKLSPSEQTAYFSLLRKGLGIVRTKDLAEVLGKSPAYARNLLVSLSKKSVVYRIGRGKYVVIPADVLYLRKGYVGDPLLLIPQLMQRDQYYIGYRSAAYFHGIIQQIPFDTSVAVLRQRRPLRLGSTRISFVKVNKKKFFGFSEVKYSVAFVNVSDIEKTVLDCVDRYDLCGGISEATRIVSEALKVEKINWDKLLNYLRKVNTKALAQRLGFILEKLSKKNKNEFKIPELVLDRIEKFVGPYTYLLDAGASGEGKLSKRWRIIENKDCMSWYRHA